MSDTPEKQDAEEQAPAEEPGDESLDARGHSGWLVLFGVALVVVLVILGSPWCKDTTSLAPPAQARRDIEDLERALQDYATELGGYPPSTTRSLDLGAESLVYHLGADFHSPSFGPYLGFRKAQLKDTDSDGKLEFCDPWGTPYRYVQPGKHNRASFDLWSCGPDKADNQGDSTQHDDINNWTRRTP